MADSIIASYRNKKIRATVYCQSYLPDPIFAACVWGFSEIVQKRPGLASEPDIKSCGNRPTSLLDLSVLEQISAEGTTYLLVPSTCCHRKIVQVLLENSANIDAKHNLGRSAFQLEVGVGHHSTVELLLDNGMDINGRDLCGNTALHLAIERGHSSMLLDRSFDVDSRRPGAFGFVFCSEPGGRSYCSIPPDA